MKMNLASLRLSLFKWSKYHQFGQCSLRITSWYLCIESPQTDKLYHIILYRPTTSTSHDSTTTLQSNRLKLTLRDRTTTLQLVHVLQSIWKDGITNLTTNYTKLTQTCSSSHRKHKHTDR